MDVPLNEIEVYMLGKLLPKLKMNDSVSLNSEMRNLVEEERAYLNATETPEKKFSQKNISSFLLDEQYARSQDGIKIFLTEKGKNLKKAGSMEKYMEWLAANRAVNKVIINTIETRGYLDQNKK